MHIIGSCRKLDGQYALHLFIRDDHRLFFGLLAWLIRDGSQKW